jgi:nicotinamide-nucleotide amidase
MKKSFNKIVIVNVGNELLSGKTVNTNLAFLGDRLFTLGLEVSEAYIIPDKREAILETLHHIWQGSVLVIITGGLGPTRDDITKNTIAEYFDKELIFDPHIYKDIEQRFALRKVPMPEINRVQAYTPAGFEALHNAMGSAPGLFYAENDSYLFCLPGVPCEMEHLFEVHIKDRLKSNDFFCRDLNTYNISESKIAELISSSVECGVWSVEFPTSTNVAWLPQTGRVNVRVYGSNTVECEKLFSEISNILKDYVWGIDRHSPVEILHERLIKDHLTIATAESCTGGMLAQMLTSQAGSSAYFKGAIVAYANEIKTGLLQVSPAILEKYGAVSEETVREMLLGCERQFQTDIVCAVSGIAGPDGGTAEKPVGTVYIGVKYLDKIVIERCLFLGDREAIRFKSAEKAVFEAVQSVECGV